MFDKTFTGFAEPCDWKRSCQDGEVWRLLSWNGIVSGLNNYYFIYILAPSSVYKPPISRQCLLTGTLEWFCPLYHDQWHSLVGFMLRKGFFLFCLTLNLISLFHPNLSRIFFFSFTWLEGCKQHLFSRILWWSDFGIICAETMTGGAPISEGVTSNPFFLLAAASRAPVKVMLQGLGSPPDALPTVVFRRVLWHSRAEQHFQGMVSLSLTPLTALSFPGCHPSVL